MVREPREDCDNEQHIIAVEFFVWADDYENARDKLIWDLQGFPHEGHVEGPPEEEDPPEERLEPWVEAETASQGGNYPPDDDYPDTYWG